MKRSSWENILSVSVVPLLVFKINHQENKGKIVSLFGILTHVEQLETVQTLPYDSIHGCDRE